MSRIMIVDSGQGIVESVKTILEAENYEVVITESNDCCPKILEKESVDPILMDFFMPEMNSRVVIKKIRGNPDLKSAKIVFLTSASFRETHKNYGRYIKN